MENLGMETDHNESFLSTPIDEEKVKDIALKFDYEKVKLQITQMREAKKEERKVKDVCNRLSSEEHYTSYDDHLRLLAEEIENQKVLIERGFEKLKLLEQKVENIKKEKETVTSENFKLPKYLAFEGFESLMKEHIFKKHPKLIGDYWGEHRYSSHAGKLKIQKIYDEKGKLNKIICLECYFKFLKENNFSVEKYPTKGDGVLEICDKVGAKI